MSKMQSPRGAVLERFSANMQQVYWRTPTWKYNLRNTLKWSSNVAQRCSSLPSIYYVIDENLSVVAGECLTVLWKLICISKQVLIEYYKSKLRYRKEKIRRLEAYQYGKNK